jgi:hypothetical protein
VHCPRRFFDDNPPAHVTHAIPDDITHFVTAAPHVRKKRPDALALHGAVLRSEDAVAGDLF